MHLRVILEFVVVCFLRSAFSDEAPHPCHRPCTGTPMTCHYDFTLESYHSVSRACFDCPSTVADCFRPHCVSADGYERSILTVNRQMPGPAIHVCENDTIVVDVHNRFENGEGSSIHFHGLHQRGSPFMDGATMVTQCPIADSTSFQYRFTAFPAGTHWWHAHSGVQRADGIHGALIIRAETSANAALYDHDLPAHTVQLAGWYHQLTSASLTQSLHGTGRPFLGLLINGRGIGETETEFPRSEFTVTQGQRYRFRVINLAGMCTMTFRVDDHRLTVIATEAGEITAEETNYLLLHPGERYDVIINADQSVASYWMRASGFCGSQTAILRYAGSGSAMPAGDSDAASNVPDSAADAVNIINENSSPPNRLTVADLRSADADDDVMTGNPDVTIYLSLDSTVLRNPRINHPDHYPDERPKNTPQINQITNRLSSSPLLTQYSDVDQDTICNLADIGKDCTVEFCECTHVVKLDRGAIVELVIVNAGINSRATHPLHLHGYSFRVLAVHKLGDMTSVAEVKALDAQGPLDRLTSRAPLKDTVTVPDGGYTIVRFKADNPGMWMFHCHLAFHNRMGMALTFQVGEPRDWATPPCDFPRCGNWRLTDECVGHPGEGKCRCKCGHGDKGKGEESMSEEGAENQA